MASAIAGLFLVGGLTACGGGSSSGSAAAPGAASVTGVAASGAPIVDGLVTLTCGGAGEAAKTVAPNASTGAFTFTLDNCSAPYVLSIAGTIGDSQGTLVSVLAAAPAAGVTTTANITPITNAIAATLASTGDPLDLIANISTEKAGLTAVLISARRDALAAALADTLVAAGLPATFDLIGGTFSADRTGMDKLLDNIKVQVTPAGVTLTNVAGTKSDDMGNTPGTAPTADLSAGGFTFTKNTTVAQATAAKMSATLDDSSIGDSIRDLINACFAQPKATRGSFAANNLSAACQAMPIATDYLNDGKNRISEFDPLLTNANYDGAVFGKPEVIRFYSSTAADTRALIKFSLVRADGLSESYNIVGERSTANTAGVKSLRGNQRLFKVVVNGFVNKRTQIANKGTIAPAGTYYSTGIQFYVGMQEGGAGGTAGTSNTGRAVGFVKVTGPGLPAAGLFLRPTLAGCDSSYAIAVSATSTPPRCTSLFRAASRAVTTTDTDNFAALFGNATRPDFAAAQVSDATISAIQPFTSYKFELFNTSSVLVATYYERLRSRPATMGTIAGKDGEVDKLRWNTLSTDTVALINTPAGTAFSGGNPSSLTVKWKNEANTAPTFSVQVQSNPTGNTLFQDLVNVAFTAGSTVLTNTGQGWPNMGSVISTSGAAFNLVQLISRNQFDTKLYADWIY